MAERPHTHIPVFAKKKAPAYIVFLYMFIYFCICLCVFAYFLYVFVNIFSVCSYKIDRLMGGGRLRRPPLIKLSILYEENPKIYTKTHKKYANTHKHM